LNWLGKDHLPKGLAYSKATARNIASNQLTQDKARDLIGSLKSNPNLAGGIMQRGLEIGLQAGKFPIATKIAKATPVKGRQPADKAKPTNAAQSAQVQTTSNLRTTKVKRTSDERDDRASKKRRIERNEPPPPDAQPNAPSSNSTTATSAQMTQDLLSSLRPLLVESQSRKRSPSPIADEPAPKRVRRREASPLADNLRETKEFKSPGFDPYAQPYPIAAANNLQQISQTQPMRSDPYAQPYPIAAPLALPPRIRDPNEDRYDHPRDRNIRVTSRNRDERHNNRSPRATRNQSYRDDRARDDWRDPQAHIVNKPLTDRRSNYRS